MFTINTIIKEINNLPPERLEEVYEFVHSLKYNPKSKKTSSKKILSFAGAFNDMSKKDYADFKKNISNTRKNLFDRGYDL